MGPAELSDTLRHAATVASLLYASHSAGCERIEKLENDLASRPTRDAYDAACKALHHWRDEAHRLAKLAGVQPRGMNHV